MAGTDPSFDSAAFRTSIQATMLMGLPNAVSDRPTFYLPVTKSWPAGTRLDEGGRPYDLTVLPITTGGGTIQPLCALQYASGSGDTFQENSVGEFNTADIVLTLLDVDYATVKGCKKVTIKGDTYDVREIEPYIGLFDVTVYRIHLRTVDET